jgi:hypothetical protein
MTAPIVYRSTDASAPVLTGAAGSLVALLHAVLVAGYGSGAQATSLGWTSAFTATNKEAYRNSATDGTGFYLNVDDTGTGNTVKEAFVVGFETMSAISVGTGQFPTSGQINLTGSAPAGALVCRKSTTADATARAWTIVGDDTVFYLFIETGDQVNPIGAMPFVFGDIFSYKASDAYRCVIIARNAANGGSSTFEVFGALMAASTTFMSLPMQGHYMPRSWTAVGGSIAVGKHIDHGKMGSFGIAGGIGGSGLSTSVAYWNNTNGVGVSIGFNNGQASFPYPNGPDGGLYLSPIWIHHNGSVRGYLKGLWAPCHDRPLNHNDTFSGTGNMSGKSFVVQSVPTVNAGAAVVGQVHIETSNTWG